MTDNILKNYDIFESTKSGVFQIRTKSDIYTVEFSDPDKAAIFRQVAEAIKADILKSFSSLRKGLESNYEKAKVMDVLHEMQEYGFLPHEYLAVLNEGKEAEAANNPKAGRPLTGSKIGILGHGELFDALYKKAQLSSYLSVNSMDLAKSPEREKLEAFMEKMDFLIVEGSHWNPFYMDLINKIATGQNKPWMYVSGLEGASAKIGPIFLGGEAGCYRCLAKRLESQHPYLELHMSYGESLREKQTMSMPDILPGREWVNDMVASWAMMEANKYLIEWSVPEVWRAYLSMDLFSYEVQRHLLLKVPYCEVCKPKLDYHAAPWLEPITLK